MKKISIFASGSGSNAENIINFFDKNPAIGVVVILSNRQDAFVHERAKKLGVPSLTFSNKEFREGEPVLKALASYGVDFIVLAGFMSLVSPLIINAFPSRIVNIHPALLPRFGGKGMYGHHVHEAVIAAKEKQSGITIHYVNERYDEGEIVFQATVPVLPDDTAADVESKVHELEYRFYPEVIDNILKNSSL
jgi:phosphoribosylglycinamide formyltransferase-1